ncbi:MAG: type II toxin-antitoxin system RelE/ParE family toxin, partial [candidate division WOR-3 bacterium]|nr:type II toxin-antitoxin system RelE/ParE family toxin [candidate division WOR-3 bacterium]
SRFPYGLVYGQEADAIVIVAVAHLHREPRYWMGRLDDA